MDLLPSLALVVAAVVVVVTAAAATTIHLSSRPVCLPLRMLLPVSLRL